MLDTLPRQDLHDRGLDQPIRLGAMREMERKAAAMEGQQLVLLGILGTGRASRNVTATLRCIPPDQRAKHALRPLLLKLAGFKPAQITVGAARKATRSRLSDVHVNPIPNPAMAMHVTMALTLPDKRRHGFTALSPNPQDVHDLHTLEGYTSMYRAVFGTLSGCPTTGVPADWAPELYCVLDSAQPSSWKSPCQPLIYGFPSTPCTVINKCSRVAEPAAQPLPLQLMLKDRYYQQKAVEHEQLASTPSQLAELPPHLLPPAGCQRPSGLDVPTGCRPSPAL